jgi:hypothetical protein
MILSFAVLHDDFRKVLFGSTPSQSWETVAAGVFMFMAHIIAFRTLHLVPAKSAVAEPSVLALAFIASLVLIIISRLLLSADHRRSSRRAASAVYLLFLLASTLLLNPTLFMMLVLLLAPWYLAMDVRSRLFLMFTSLLPPLLALDRELASSILLCASQRSMWWTTTHIIVCICNTVVL